MGLPQKRWGQVALDLPSVFHLLLAPYMGDSGFGPLSFYVTFLSRVSPLSFPQILRGNYLPFLSLCLFFWMQCRKPSLFSLRYTQLTFPGLHLLSFFGLIVDALWLMLYWDFFPLCVSSKKKNKKRHNFSHHPPQPPFSPLLISFCSFAPFPDQVFLA